MTPLTRIPTLEEAVTALTAARDALNAKQRRIAEIEGKVKEFDAQAQAAPDGSAMRITADDNMLDTQRQLDRAKGDLLPLQDAIREAELNLEAARYLSNFKSAMNASRESLSLSDDLDALKKQRYELDAQIKTKQDQLDRVQRDGQQTNNTLRQMEQRLGSERVQQARAQYDTEQA